MLYRITVLKAPWPSGAVVGDVIDMPAVPAWAAGKCEPASDGAAATVGKQPVRDQAGAVPAAGPDGATPAPASRRSRKT